MSQKRNTSMKSSEQRKAEYRDLLNRVEILQENEETSSRTADVIDEIISQADLLFIENDTTENMKHTDEVLLDAKLVSSTSHVLYTVTEAINCAVDTYDPVELARKIRSRIASEEEDGEVLNWRNIYNRIESIINYTPNFQYLYGGIGNTISNTQVKERKARQKQNKLESVPKKQPEKITSVTKEEDSVDDTVKFLQWAVKQEYENGEQPLNYMQMLIDPKDFSATIENIFHFSFLVRDGRMEILWEDNGAVKVRPVLQNEAKRAKKSDISYKQSIFSLDMNEWQDLIKKYQIQHCFLDKWRHLWEEKKTT